MTMIVVLHVHMQSTEYEHAICQSPRKKRKKKRMAKKVKKKKMSGALAPIKRMDNGKLAPSAMTDVHVRLTHSHQRPLIIVVLILLEKVVQIGATLADCSLIPSV